jgi:hypothetical protein
VDPPVDRPGPKRSLGRSVIGTLLKAWGLIYLLVILYPLTHGGELSGPMACLVVAAIMFWPWIVGVAVLGLVWWLIG